MLAALLFSILALHATPALAQDQDGMPACTGDITIMYVSEIKPGGSLDGFMAAVAAHKQWYVTHGYTDNQIVISRLIVTDPRTHTAKYSDTHVVTYHVRPPGGSTSDPPEAGDAAWNAYIKLYRDNSDLKATYVTCMPKASR